MVDLLHNLSGSVLAYAVLGQVLLPVELLVTGEVPELELFRFK